VKITFSARPTRTATTSSNSSMSPGMAQGCVTLFALPFAGVGVFALVQAAGLLQRQQLAQAAGLGGFGALFGAAGFGLIAAGFKARTATAALQARQAAAPDQPWLWREDWAKRLIPDTSRASAVGLWVFAIFWNLIALPVSYLALKNGIAPDNKAALLVLLFPLVGLGVLASATYTAMRARRYGVSVLELVAVPIPLGREIAGRIHVPGVFEPEQGVKVSLTCAREVTTGSGKNRSTTTTLLWQDDLTVPGVTRDATGVAIPFLMQVPADCPPSDDRNSSNKVIWKVTAEAAVAGIDYSASFEVPVFHTAESDAPAPADVVAREQERMAEYRLPADAPVKLEETGRGVDVAFPMGRNPGVAFGITVFAILWSAVVYALVRFEAPWLFRIVFAAVDLLVVAIALWLWFGHSELHADSTGLTFNSGFGPFMKSRRFGPDEMVSVRPKVGMTAGNRAYFDLHLVFKDGSELTAGSGLSDPRQVEWVGSKLRGALGGAAGQGGSRS
jgi:hypothetical protein